MTDEVYPNTSTDVNSPALATNDCPMLDDADGIGCREIIVNGGQENTFCPNTINTARYSVVTFFPKFLYNEFRKLANVFFLFVGLLEQIPGVSPVGRYITLLPLSLILLVSAIKEAAEDMKRRSSDVILNAHTTHVLRHKWEIEKWSRIQVGDIIRMESGETAPADIIVLYTSEVSNGCYVQTASLDGETNYKPKQSRMNSTMYSNEATLSNTKIRIVCEQPNNNLYQFSGNMRFDNQESLAISIDQLIMRGSQLKNTHWVIGVVIYTGHETKIMLNSSSPTVKRSGIDSTTNWLVLTLMAVLLIMTLVCASIYDVFLHEVVPDHWYLGTGKSIGFTFHISCTTFFILFHNIIPISLSVTLEVVKMAQSYIISHDVHMFSKVSSTSAIVQASSIVEELGQVNYIFSDKTGTLTCNEMILRLLSMGCEIYKLAPGSEFAFNQTNNEYGITEFEYCIANLLLCNSIVPEYDDKGADVVYQSSSPDETAIVTALAEKNYKFLRRTSEGATIDMNGRVETWEILSVIDFTSERKRMSVITRSPSCSIILFCKGADSVICERLSSTSDAIYESTLNNLETFAKGGLRTMCIAYKVISPKEYEEWVQEFDIASRSVYNRETKVEKIADCIERNLILLGASGIEDKLQAGVPDTISILRKAKIHIWMLTGDKLETAVNVGFSCGLLDVMLDVRTISCSSVDECLRLLRVIQSEKKLSPTPRGKTRKIPVNQSNLALVLTGHDLAFALDPECLETFLDIAIYCESIICCRISPLQKRHVLLMVKDHVSEATTLAIGDGANDCSMIQAAHIGVGIVGKEGMQAANTADFAIGEFHHLARLLLVHGATCYRRICNCIYFCFYKNIVFNVIPFFYDFLNLFSGQIIFSKISLAFFNVIYTGLPSFCFGILDQSCSLEAHLRVPYLYESIRKSSPFGVRRFVYWVLNGILHSFLIFSLCYSLCSNGVITWDGHPISMALFGNIVFTHTLLVLTLKAALELRYWVWLTHFGIWSGLVFYFITLVGFCRRWPYRIWMEPDLFDSDILMYQSPLFWFSLGIPIIVLLPDFIFHSIRNTWFKPSFVLISEIEQQAQINWSEPSTLKSVEMELDKSFELKARRTRKYFGFAFSMSESSYQIRNKLFLRSFTGLREYQAQEGSVTKGTP